MAEFDMWSADHATLSASSADRWLACPPSATINTKAGSRTSTYAEEGTLAHEVCELRVKQSFGVPEPLRPPVFRKRMKVVRENPLFHEEMIQCAETFLDVLKEVVYPLKGRPFLAVEQKLDFSHVVPEGFGTADFLCITDDTIHIFDYKHGKGVVVDVVDNSQMKLYALGALNMFSAFYPNVKTVVLHIIQPRVDNICEWSMSVDDLNKWADEVVVPTAKLAIEGLGELNPGEKQCRWCSNNGICTAQVAQAYELAKKDFFQAPPDALTTEQYGEILTLTKSIASWAKKLEERTKTLLLAGETVPGYKMVAGRSTRSWTEFNEAFAALETAGVDSSLMWERTPLSVAKMEKVIDKTTFAKVAEQFIVKAPGAPTLVPESDKRPAFVPAQEDFKQFITEG